VADILLALYYLNASSSIPTTDPAFPQLYKKAINEYTQRAFKLDKEYPLTCTTFAGYFFSHRNMNHVENLARKAIEHTDVNAIASDGWYLLARRSHYMGDIERTSEYYRRADEARGGTEKGYLPAKFGIAQLQVLAGDLDGAKFRLDKIVQQSKSLEAMTLLATLYAEDVFKNQANGFREDKSNEAKKAIALFEAVRLAWKDPKKNLKPDSAVLLNLARLYETDHPEKSLQLLQQVEQMEIDMLPESDRPTRTKTEGEDEGKAAEEEAALTATIRENLPPQLLNNMGCFQYQAEKYDQAREMFQIALNACVKPGLKADKVDVDALVTTISFNLARTYEAAGLLDEAKGVYEGLLGRHEDYTDALTRLAYIALRQNPNGEGPKAVSRLYQSDSTNLEVRALYGWYLGKSKKRTANIAEDPEQRHYKHTLQHHEKHDRYSLTGMGNLYLTTAREMRRDSESDKEKRRKTYEKAVEFFDKAVQLDPKNAYAAQGIAIALIEDKRDFAGAVQIFMKVKETIRDASVYINLGHAYAELRQYSRAIENVSLRSAFEGFTAFYSPPIGPVTFTTSAEVLLMAKPAVRGSPRQRQSQRPANTSMFRTCLAFEGKARQEYSQCKKCLGILSTGEGPLSLLVYFCQSNFLSLP
jgi:RNA polymerase-associated protein CTR9